MQGLAGSNAFECRNGNEQSGQVSISRYITLAREGAVCRRLTSLQVSPNRRLRQQIWQVLVDVSELEGVQTIIDRINQAVSEIKVGLAESLEQVKGTTSDAAEVLEKKTP